MLDITVGPNLEWQGVRVFVALFATMGCRKEAIALGKGEAPGPRKLMLKAVVYRFEQAIVAHPSRAQLQAALDGCFTLVLVYVIPCPCKNDPTGAKFGNSPVPSRLHPTRRINLAREIIRYELLRHTDGCDRAKEPLVLGPGGKMWTKAQLDKLFKALFSLVVSEQRLAQLTVHSFRVYLACALLAAGATPEQVMQLLRWSSDSARKLYARIADTTQAGLIDSAADAAVDTIRSHTLTAAASAPPPASPAETAAQLRAQTLETGERLLERAMEQVRIATAAELRRRGVAIDDDHVYARLRDDGPALRAAAERHDACAGEGLDGVDSDDDVGNDATD